MCIIQVDQKPKRVEYQMTTLSDSQYGQWRIAHVKTPRIRPLVTVRITSFIQLRHVVYAVVICMKALDISSILDRQIDFAYLYHIQSSLVLKYNNFSVRTNTIQLLLCQLNGYLVKEVTYFISNFDVGPLLKVVVFVHHYWP